MLLSSQQNIIQLQLLYDVFIDEVILESSYNDTALKSGWTLWDQYTFHIFQGNTDVVVAVFLKT